MNDVGPDTQEKWKEENAELDDRFIHLDEFVAEFLSPAIQRNQNGLRAIWCPRWWAHPEAVARLHALWRAFEALRLQGGTGMSAWWINHADRHFDVLFNPEAGPFMFCRYGHTNDGHPLELVRVPDGWWDLWQLDSEVPDLPPENWSEHPGNPEDGTAV